MMVVMVSHVRECLTLLKRVRSKDVSDSQTILTLPSVLGILGTSPCPRSTQLYSVAVATRKSHHDYLKRVYHIVYILECHKDGLIHGNR